MATRDSLPGLSRFLLFSFAIIPLIAYSATMQTNCNISQASAG